MNPFAFLQEECESVRKALKETLRHDYGPDRSREYYEECEARLAFIQEAIDRGAALNAAEIADNMRDLARIGTRVALIERSHLGEFSWPFTDVIRDFATKLFFEEELYGKGPIVHVIAEGTGYQVIDDPASRTGTRRILIVAFPRQLKHHVLLHAIFGHELGHPAARTDDLGDKIASAVLKALKAGSLRSRSAARDWLNQDDAPEVVGAELRKQSGRTPTAVELRHWRTEIFCDLFGLILFGPAFAAAHRATLEPSSGWPSKIDLSSSSHPPYAVRRRVVVAAMRLRKWHLPCTSKAHGAAHAAEKAMLAYATEDDRDPWLTVLPDEDLESVLSKLDDLFAAHADIVYAPPKSEVLVRLINRVTLGRPPIADGINEAGVATNECVAIQHCLYAGWSAWFGRDKLRKAKLRRFLQRKPLSFHEINRLCEQALLQQRAIDTAMDWRLKHPGEAKRADDVAAPAARDDAGHSSGTLGRSAIIARIRSEELSVAPLLSSDQIGASSVDLRMGNLVLIVRARGSSHVDPKRAMHEARKAGHDQEAGLQQKHERYELKFKTPFLLHPGTLALVPTLEWVSLPADLMGNVTARSTWAREGLSIATATMIEPGYEGIVTLELANLGEIPIALYPGLKLAQIAFVEVVGSTTRPKKGQFELSFEPRQGALAKESEYPFLPEEQVLA